MNQRKTPPCPPGLRSANRAAKRQFETLACDPVPGTVWEVRSPSGEILRVLVVEYFKAGEESPFAFARCVAITSNVGSIGARDTFVELEPAEELAVAHCWLEGPIREVLLQRCVATVSTESMLRIEENREPLAVPELPTQVASFRKLLRQQLNVVFRDSWRELYEQLENDSAPETVPFSGSKLKLTNKWRSDLNDLRLAAKGSNPTAPYLLSVEDDPNTIVRLTAGVDKDEISFLLQRSPDASTDSDPLDVYERIEVVDNKGTVHGQVLTVLPSKVTLPVDNQIESISLIAKSPDHRKHALFDRSQ